MLEESRQRILDLLGPTDQVLDVGGWASPFPRADWVIDLQPYETRGLYGYDDVDRDQERFTAASWVQADICDHAPWPFADGQFDFAICSHTLEDVRDPIRVCAELQRVAKAGYIEVPSRVEEQSVGVDGNWPGWAHHRWLCDVRDKRIEFVHKSHFLRAGGEHTLSGESTMQLPMAARRLALWWTDSFEFGERVLMTDEELRSYLAEVAPNGAPPRPLKTEVRALARRLAQRFR
jgi:hypothetical protein